VSITKLGCYGIPVILIYVITFSLESYFQKEQAVKPARDIREEAQVGVVTIRGVVMIKGKPEGLWIVFNRHGALQNRTVEEVRVVVHVYIFFDCTARCLL
jgi:hypothetical protein